jgi:hypothetical protein
MVNRRRAPAFVVILPNALTGSEPPAAPHSDPIETPLKGEFILKGEFMDGIP